MKILLVDISGKVSNYDKALFGALRNMSDCCDYSVKLLLPGHGLLRLIPGKKAKSKSLLKRLVMVIASLLNYFHIILFMLLKKVEILHLQWLPFMEVTNWENGFLKIIRFFSPQTKIVLTIHNIYPHNMSSERKLAYKKRFCKASKLIDGFIVHTKTSKQDVIREYNISKEKVFVACHGVFEPKGITLDNAFRKDGKLHILQFGGQSYYKGTDILVEAVNALPDEYKEKIEVKIVGGISNSFLQECKQKDKNNLINWKPYFLSDEELNEDINNSDLVVVPYRAISQSGVLLLAIYFEKIILTSNLPSFKETLSTYSDDLFFESENIESLKNAIMRYVDDKLNLVDIKNNIRILKNLYTWSNAARQTLNVYKTINQL